MTSEQIDAACAKIVALIEAGTRASEVVAEARAIAAAWRRMSAPDLFAEAVALFAFAMQDTADEIEALMPMAAEIEKRGLTVTFSVGDTAPVTMCAPIEGATAILRRAAEGYLAVVDALEAETPRPVQSLGAWLGSDPFLRVA